MNSAHQVATAQARIEDFAPFLRAETNPLLAGGRLLSRPELTRVLLDFAALSKALPAILEAAERLCREPELLPLRQEIRSNIAEETGQIECMAGFEGRSHYSILRSEIVAFAGADPDYSPAFPATSRFIAGIVREVSTNAPRVFGALLALETTAIPEIQIFKQALERHALACRTAPPELLLKFFDAHTNQFEVEHAARLCALYDSVASTTSASSQIDFGFNAVLSLMDDWWQALSVGE